MLDAFSPAPSELPDITIWNLDNAANFLCCLLTETRFLNLSKLWNKTYVSNPNGWSKALLF